MSSTEELAQWIPCFSSAPEHAENGCGKCTGCETAARLRELEAENLELTRDRDRLEDACEIGDKNIAELEAEREKWESDWANEFAKRGHETAALERKIAELEAANRSLLNGLSDTVMERDDLQRRIDSAPKPAVGKTSFNAYCDWYNTDGPGRDE